MSEKFIYTTEDILNECIIYHDKSRTTIEEDNRKWVLLERAEYYVFRKAFTDKARWMPYDEWAKKHPHLAFWLLQNGFVYEEKLDIMKPEVAKNE